MAFLNNKQSMFGKNFKYVFILTALAWLTYTLPSVRAAFETASADDGSSAVAAAGSDAIKNFFAGFKLHSSDDQGRSMSEVREARMATVTPPVFRPGEGRGTSTPPMAPRQIAPLQPQEVVSILVKLGFIPNDKVEAAHKAIEEYQRSRSGHMKNGTTTPPAQLVPVSGTMPAPTTGGDMAP